MLFVFDVIPEERTAFLPFADFPAEHTDGTIRVCVDKLVPVFNGYATVECYYRDGFAKTGRATEATLRRRFPKSYPK